MEKVTGIGGLFFQARDPEALCRWYRDHLGVALTPTSYDDAPSMQDAGPTVFAPFPESTEPNGRFARLHDPEGNPVELWEPRGAAQR